MPQFIKRFKDPAEVATLLKDEVDLCEWITNDVGDPVTASGKNRFWLCPFHDENEPSFCVNVDLRFFKCFGSCENVAGDLIDYVRLKESTDFMGAIHVIVDKIGLDLSPYYRDLTPQEEQENLWLSIFDDAAIFLHGGLLSDSGIAAYKWMTDIRGVSDSVLREFRVGYSNNTDELISHLLNRKYKYKDVEKLGLTSRAHFDHTVVMPIYDPYGYCVRMHNRRMDYDGHDKYLGTVTTEISNRAPLYGFHIARKYLEAAPLIGVEGNVDVLAMHSHGYYNTVGHFGKSITSEQYELMARFMVRDFIWVPDGDSAGWASINRLIYKRDQEAVSFFIRTCRLPADTDPASILMKDGGDKEMEAIINTAKVPLQQVIDDHLEKHEIHDLTSLAKLFSSISSLIVNISEMEKRLLIKYVADKFGLDKLDVEESIKLNCIEAGALYNIKGEQSLILSMLEDQDTFMKTTLRINEGDFYFPKNQKLIRVMKVLMSTNKMVSYESLIQYLNDTENESLIHYLISLTKHTGNIDFLIEDILEKSNRRKLYSCGDSLHSDALDYSQSIDRSVADSVNDLSIIGNLKYDLSNTSPQASATEFQSALVSSMVKSKKIIGFDLGQRFKSLTQKLSGLQLGHDTVIAGPQGRGKTALALNFLVSMCIEGENRVPALFISGEMARRSIITRIVAILTKIDSRRIASGNINIIEKRFVDHAIKAFYKSELYVYEANSMTQAEVLYAIEEHRNKYGCKVAVIDYLQLMVPDAMKTEYSQRYRFLEDLSGVIKRRCSKPGDNLLIIPICQLTREAARTGESHDYHIGGAYKIIQDSDRALMIEAKSDVSIEKDGIQAGNIYFKIEKDRHGEGDIKFQGWFDKALGSLRMGIVRDGDQGPFVKTV